MNSLAIRVSKVLRSSSISPLGNSSFLSPKSSAFFSEDYHLFLLVLLWCVAISAERGSKSWFSTGPIDEGVEEDFEENVTERPELQPHGVDPRKGWGFRGVHRVKRFDL